MSRSDTERVADIRAACSRLAEIVKLGREEFDRNWLAVSAASYELAVIGEAMAHLSDEFLKTHSSVPTRKAKSLRNLLMHEYFRAEPEILWDTIVSDIPDLVRILDSVSPPAEC
ncbi:DUF86 domain-containing protein [Candidatus Poriferisodalis sp.]|uniref:HepT-like ribonuclease domain-containing protein n=1 Tax=Candidatus Poriferisodalis sp. TaxID=3101277 RepID=UPI003B5A1880